MTCIEVECLDRQDPEARAHLRMSRRELFLPGTSPQASTLELAAQSTIMPPKSHAQAESTNDSWTLSAEGNLELLATDRSAEAGTEKLGPGHMAIVVNSGL